MKQAFDPASPFFTLLRAALNAESPPSLPELRPDEWEAIYAEAVKQTVAAGMFDAVALLPQTVLPPAQLLAKWAARQAAVEARNGKVNLIIARSARSLRAEDIEPVLLKGQGIARLYPNPLARECGDIDLFFPDKKQQERAAEILAEGTAVAKPDGSMVFAAEGVTVELHNRMFDMQTPANARLLSQAAKQWGVEEVALDNGGEAKIAVPAPTLNLLMQSLHILRHALSYGIGLRQLCDFAVTLRNAPAGTFEELTRLHSSLGLERWFTTLTSFVGHWLGAKIAAETRQSDGEPLLEVVMKGGNFGFHSHRRTPLTVLRSNTTLFKVAPKQSIATLTHLILRKRK